MKLTKIYVNLFSLFALVIFGITIGYYSKFDGSRDYIDHMMLIGVVIIGLTRRIALKYFSK